MDYSWSFISIAAGRFGGLVGSIAAWSDSRLLTGNCFAVVLTVNASFAFFAALVGQSVTIPPLPTGFH
jgi:hypothetical protein